MEKDEFGVYPDDIAVYEYEKRKEYAGIKTKILDGYDMPIGE